MTNRVIQFAAIGALSFVAFASANAQAKFAYVNSRKIMAEAPGRAEAESAFAKEQESAGLRLKSMQDSIRGMFEAYDKEAASLDSVARLAREKILRDKEEMYRATERVLDSTLQIKQNDLVRPLMDQVSRVLDEIRAQGGYAMIFDVAGGAGVVVSADTTLDISDKVLARLKQLGPPKSSSPSTPAPGPIRSSGAIPPKR